MTDSNTIHGDEVAELAALQRQMMGDQVQPGQQPTQVPYQPQQAQPPQQAHQQEQTVPIPRYEPPPPEFPVEPPPQVPGQAPNQGWNSQVQQPQAPQQQPNGGPAAPGVIEERRRRQEAENDQRRTQQQLEETRHALARIEERTSMLGDVVARGQQQELDRNQSMPTWEDDPEGFIRETNRRAVETAVKEGLKPFEDKQKQHDAIIEEETRNRQIANHLQAQARIFEQQHPDFRQAYDFYQNARRQDLLTQGFTPGAVQNHVEAEERVVAEAHMRDGRNIPEAVYSAAISRGYRPGANPAPQGSPGGQNYQAPQPAPQAPQPGYAQPQLQNYQALPGPAPNYAPQPQLAPQYAPQPQPAPQIQPYYSGQPDLGNMQAGMMAGSHLADVGPNSSLPTGIPTMDQLATMPEDQLIANKAFADAHIQGLINAGH